MNSEKLRAGQEQSYKSQINVLRQLAENGHENSARVLAKIDMPVESTQQEQPIPEAMKIVSLFLNEARYRAVTTMAVQSGCHFALDFPCGYSTHGMSLADKDFKYLGCDYPVVTNAMSAVIDEIGTPEEKANIKFVAISEDGSYDELLSAVEGPVCVLSQGCFVYSDQENAEKFCQYIARLLKKFGGCWITPDPDTGKVFMGGMVAMLGKEALAGFQRRKEEVSKETSISFYNTFIEMDESKRQSAYDFLEECGLKLEKIPYSDLMSKCDIFDRMTEEQAAAAKGVLATSFVWKLTAK